MFLFAMATQLRRQILKTLLNTALSRPAVCYQTNRYLKIGDTLPDIKIYQDNPEDSVSVRELFKGKKGVLFSVVGAFTPGCTHAHIPEYLESADKFKEEGYDLIGCVSVNDPYVMSAWGRDLKADGKIKMLADTNGDFTRAMGMELDCTRLLGSIRSKSYGSACSDQQFRIKTLSLGAAAALVLFHLSSAVWRIHIHFYFRYSLVIEDSKIQTINEDPQHSGLVCLLCIRNLKTKQQMMS